MKGLIAAAVLAVSGLAFAQQESMKPEPKDMKTEMKSDKAASKDQNLYQEATAFEIQGTVSKKSGSSLTIARPDLPAADLKIHDQTVITLNGQKVSVNELAEGTAVRARFQLKGSEPVAVSVEAQPKEMKPGEMMKPGEKMPKPNMP